MFKRRIIIVLIALLLVTTFTGFTQEEFVPIKDKYWNQIPTDQRFNLTVKDYSGSRKLAIAGYHAKKSILELFFNDVEALLNLFSNNWPNQHVLIVSVAPFGSQYFYPSNFAFTQGYSQYDLNIYEDMMNISEMFSGGELKSGTATGGVIAIPKRINLDEPFKIWYGDYSTTIDFSS